MEPTFNTLIAPFAESAPPPPPNTPELPPEPAPAPQALAKHLAETLLAQPAEAPPAKPEPPKLTRQKASVDLPPKKERPIPDMKPLVPLPEEWMRALEEADPKELQPLEPLEDCPVLPGGLDPNTVLVIACIVVGGVLGYMCYKSHPAAAPVVSFD